MFIFDKEVKWADIVKSPIRYLNAQWEYDEFAPTTFIRPWIHHTYNQQQVFRRFPIPAEWLIAEQTLRGRFVDGEQTRTPRKIRIEVRQEGESHLLNATMSQMDGNSNWINDEMVSRGLSSLEGLDFRARVRRDFWIAGELETDYGEPVIIWSLEGFFENQYRSITQFYSENPKHDCVADFGGWILGVAGIQPLESFLGGQDPN